MFPVSPLFIILSILFSNLPDSDSLFLGKIRGHRESVGHTPFLWAIIFFILLDFNLMVFILPFSILILFFIQVGFHLLFDFIIARNLGIQLFYPFIQKRYKVFSEKDKNIAFFIEISILVMGFYILTTFF